MLGYAVWRDSTTVIDKAREACEAAGEKVSDHFVGINEMVAPGPGSECTIEDIASTRYACYLIAKNGDPAKPAIAFAQACIVVQTRKREVIEQRFSDVARVTVRDKLMPSEKKLSGLLYERGVDHAGFAEIRSSTRGGRGSRVVARDVERRLKSEEQQLKKGTKRIGKK